MPGPASCIIAGIVLVAPQRFRAWLALPAAAFCGFAIGTAIGLHDPSIDDWHFAGAAAGLALWLVGVPLLTARAFRQPWFAIAGRIAGSWLTAIGLLLGAALLIPQEKDRLPDAPASPAAPLGEPSLPSPAGPEPEVAPEEPDPPTAP